MPLHIKMKKEIKEKIIEEVNKRKGIIHPDKIGRKIGISPIAITDVLEELERDGQVRQVR